MDKPRTDHRPVSAINLKITAVLLFVAMAGIVKEATQEVPVGQAVFFRSLMPIPIILLWLRFRGELRTGLVANNVWGHIWRGLFGSSAVFLTFAGLSLILLPEATAI